MYICNGIYLGDFKIETVQETIKKLFTLFNLNTFDQPSCNCNFTSISSTKSIIRLKRQWVRDVL